MSSTLGTFTTVHDGQNIIGTLAQQTNTSCDPACNTDCGYWLMLSMYWRITSMQVLALTINIYADSQQENTSTKVIILSTYFL